MNPSVPVRRLLYIPTDRYCSPAIESAAAEIARFQERTAEACLLLVIEHRDADYVAAHAETIARLRAVVGIDIDHLTPDRWNSLLGRIVRRSQLDQQERRRVTTLLSPQGTAYGAGPNKAALYASSSGISRLHRRDSDQTLDQRNGVASTLDIEAVLLDSEVSVENDPHGRKSIPVRYVGSDVDGMPARDRRDLIFSDRRFDTDIDALSRISAPTTKVPNIRFHLPDYPPIISRWKPTLDTDGRTEVGISAVAEIFKWLPEMPASGVFGCDCFQKNLLYQLGLPVIYHDRRPLHTYHDTRMRQTDHDAEIRYVLSEVRYSVLRLFWNYLNQAIVGNRTHVWNPVSGFDAGKYAEQFTKTVCSIEPHAARIPAQFAEIYRRAAVHTNDSRRAARLKKKLAAIESDGSQVLSDVVRAIMDFAWLTERWQKLSSVRCPSLISTTASGGSDAT